MARRFHSRQLLQGKPAILTMVYYKCPMLCTEVLNATLNSLKEVPLEIGKDFSVITVSIDPRKSRFSPKRSKSCTPDFTDGPAPFTDGIFLQATKSRFRNSRQPWDIVLFMTRSLRSSRMPAESW